MEETTANKRAKSREKSEQQLLDAVGKLLRTKGHTALKVNDIAATAKLDKKLIYRYFGSTDQLLDKYVLSHDFWSNVKGERIPAEINDGGRAFSVEMLQAQFDTVYTDKELQKILLWRLSQQRNSLKKLAEEQEIVGEQIFTTILDPYFNDKSRDFRAIIAILVAGMYYLNMSATYNSSMFCGLDIKNEQDRASIKEAISFIIQQSYDNL